MTTSSVGNERFKSDKRQFGGLLLALGIAVTFQPLANIAAAIGPAGTTVSSGLPLAGLISGIILVFVGTVGMLIGYLSLVHDYGNKYLTGFLISIVQFTFIPFFTDLISVGRGARSGEAFIPMAYDPSEGDVKFVGAMGILGVLVFATSFVGSFAFMAFSLFAYQTGNPSNRSSPYYSGRSVFYACLITIAGLSQLMLGSFVLSKFGGGPLESGTIGVAMYVVNFPEITIVVGLVQLLTGIFGIGRRYGLLNNGKDDNRYQVALFFTWLCMLSMQIMTQVSYLPGDALASAAPTIACLSLGMTMLPAFLDFKMRTTPEHIAADYYGFEKGSKEVADKKESTEHEQVDNFESIELGA